MEKLALYEQLLNLPTLEIDEVIVEAKSITVECHVKQSFQPCANCGVNSSSVNQYYNRHLRDLNMGERHVYLLVKMKQFYCVNCNRYYSEMLDFADLNGDAQSKTIRIVKLIICSAWQVNKAIPK